MSFKLLLLVFSVLLIAKVTLGEIDCKRSPFDICVSPRFLQEIPPEVSEFNVHCVETLSYLRCAKEYQDECRTPRLTLFRRPELFEASYSTISDVCEQGTLLNTVATENLKCLNETFGKTKCSEEARELVGPLVKQAREEEDFEYTISFSCLRDAHVHDCVLRATGNCGKLAEEATLEFILRTKSLEYSCSEEDVQSVLNEIDNLNLSEDKKKSMSELLEKLVPDRK